VLVKSRDRKCKGGYQRLGGGETGEFCLPSEHSVSLWEAENVLEVDGGEGSMTVGVYLMPPHRTLNDG